MRPTRNYSSVLTHADQLCLITSPTVDACYVHSSGKQAIPPELVTKACLSQICAGMSSDSRGDLVTTGFEVQFCSAVGKVWATIEALEN
jgi:hypothetical protein